MEQKEIQQHKKFLAMAVQLAQENVGSGKGGPFGAVIVKDGQVLATGTNQVLSTQDPTMHAEVSAIRNACAKLKSFDLKDCVIYSSCEPCPMCLGAIYWARPKALYYAADQHTAARHGFDDKFIYDEFDLPPQERKIKAVRLLLQEQEEPFKAWTAKEDKVQY
ncbi:MAG: nucleoside deaminase [Elusimicrobiaceae bacterium]|nr:nucleoside deaminase [Elusimicrobiaceae bacterium]